MTTSWARSRAFSLVMMRLTWVLDVSGLRNRRPAISSLDRPSATSDITSRSRSVRPTRIWSLGGSADAPGGLQAVHSRHPDVHQHDVGARTAGQVHRLGAVDRLADHLKVIGGVDQPVEPRP